MPQLCSCSRAPRDPGSSTAIRSMPSAAQHPGQQGERLRDAGHDDHLLGRQRSCPDCGPTSRRWTDETPTRPAGSGSRTRRPTSRSARPARPAASRPAGRPPGRVRRASGRCGRARREGRRTSSCRRYRRRVPRPSVEQRPVPVPGRSWVDGGSFAAGHPGDDDGAAPAPTGEQALVGEPLVGLGDHASGDREVGGKDSAGGQRAAGREPVVRDGRAEFPGQPVGPATGRGSGDAHAAENPSRVCRVASVMARRTVFGPVDERHDWTWSLVHYADTVGPVTISAPARLAPTAEPCGGR